MQSLQRKNKKYLAFILLAGLILVGYFLFDKYWNGPDRKIAARCINYSATQPGLIDCFGTISIYDSWDADYLSIDDHVHNYELARIFDLRNFRVAGNKFYVKNEQIIEGYVSDGKKIQYYQKLFQDNQLKTNYYSAQTDIPQYFVIDYKTGEVSAYKDLKSVPANERNYFGSLEKR